MRAVLLALTIASAALVTAGSLVRPASAVALESVPVQHVVVFQSDGSATQHASKARTVAEFLAERGITPNDADYVRPSGDTPLSDNLVIEYRAAIPVHVVTATRNV
ncbi:MAG: ubiquitin-like domain-containing protein, partial [Candidatus Eremiobacteraeota bacterium]|nr:ubiquitin-like domain-containing protein [Candidatus Eremiobacteraeota bacterium]